MSRLSATWRLMIATRGWTWGALALLTGLAGPPAAADVYQSIANQRNMLPGGRASLMGGAFTAVADDSSASFYNPAGLALLKENRVEASATAYRSANLRYDEVINDQPFTEHSELIYPSFIGGTGRFGAVTVGYAYLTLDAQNIYQQDKYEDISAVDGAASSYSRTYQESSSFIYVGGSVAMSLGKNLSVGSSVFYYERNIRFSANELVQLNGGGISTINNTLSTVNTGIAQVTGLMWRADTWSAGASLRTAMSNSNSSELLTDQVTYEPDDAATNGDGQPVPSVENYVTKTKVLNELNPTTYGLGLSWHPGRWLLISSDILVHEGVKSPYRGGNDLHTTLNYSLGLDLTLGPIHFMGGAFTNNSMYRAPDPELSGQPVHIDFIGYGGGVGWELGAFTGAVGMQRQVGEGEAQIRTNSSDIQKVAGEVTTYIIAGKVPL